MVTHRVPEFFLEIPSDREKMIPVRFYFCESISLGPYRTIFRVNKPQKKLKIKENQIFKLLIIQFSSNCFVKPYSSLKSA